MQSGRAMDRDLGGTVQGRRVAPGVDEMATGTLQVAGVGVGGQPHRGWGGPRDARVHGADPGVTVGPDAEPS